MVTDRKIIISNGTTSVELTASPYTVQETKGFDRLEIEQNQDTGMIRVMMPGTSGTVEVTVKYEMTKYQKISYIMLVVGIGVLLILIWEERRKVHD